MTLISSLLRVMRWQLNQHNQLMQQFFKQDIKKIFTPEELKILGNLFQRLNQTPPFQINNKQIDQFASELESKVNKDGINLSIDVQQFKPDDITVKTIDNTVIIEGKHEERSDESGLISRQFVRKYTIPQGYSIKDLISTLSADGILTIKAPFLGNFKETNERIIKIERINEKVRKIKEN